jgi:hypothetical protein
MADFKLRAPPRLRLSALVSIGGVIGQGAAVPLAGSALASAQAAAALLRGVNLGGAASASAQATAALLRGLRLQGAAVAGASGAGALDNIFGGSWSVGTINILAGASGLPAGQFDLRTTGPSGYALGGVYDVDVAGSQPPAGITLSESGAGDVGSAGIGLTSGVNFAYAEPGAYATLTLHPSVTGTKHYMATWCPNEGVVPTGYNAVSPDDANLRGAILSTWGDGSAKVIALAGETAVTNGVSKAVRLRVGQPSGTNLTTARINAVVSTVAVNFGGGVQTLTLSGATPDRTWWASPRLICARYRLSCGLGGLEAVIDIHAFASGAADRALVEVVVENCSLSATAPTAPAPQTYANATIAVNGTTIATVNDPAVSGSKYTGGQHDAFRAFYCAATVEAGAVIALTTAAQQAGPFGVEVSQDATSLQAHPMLFKTARASSYNYLTQSFSTGTTGMQDTFTQPYASDVYSPWWTGRHRDVFMGAGADHASIGALTAWAARYVQSGDRYVRRAALANDLAALSYGINYRDSNTRNVTNPEDIRTRLRGGSGSQEWPSNGAQPAWEVAHQPEVGLVSFMCRPSPVFIELAQKVALWNCSIYLDSNIYYQARGRAWGLRNLGHAIFLTPDSQSTLKAGLKAALARNVTNISGFFKDIAGNPLNLIVDSASPSVTSFLDHRSAAGFQQGVWQHHFCAVVLHRLAGGKLLDGGSLSALNALANWACEQPVRYVTEQANGGWRFHRYETTVGTNNYGSGGAGTPMGQLATWGLMQDWWMNDDPATVAGPWKVASNGDDAADQSYASSTFQTQTAATQVTEDYAEHFWLALVAGVEREVTGAPSAWSTVQANVTGLSAWLDGFAQDARKGAYPRNV